MTKLQKQKHDARVATRLKELPSLAPTTPRPDEVKQAVKKLNAKNFFIELVYSLAPGKGMTSKQQMQYKRVLAFLDA